MCVRETLLVEFLFSSESWSLSSSLSLSCRGRVNDSDGLSTTICRPSVDLLHTIGKPSARDTSLRPLPRPSEIARSGVLIRQHCASSSGESTPSSTDFFRLIINARRSLTCTRRCRMRSSGFAPDATRQSSSAARIASLARLRTPNGNASQRLPGSTKSFLKGIRVCFPPPVRLHFIGILPLRDGALQSFLTRGLFQQSRGIDNPCLLFKRLAPFGVARRLSLYP